MTASTRIVLGISLGLFDIYLILLLAEQIKIGGPENLINGAVHCKLE